MQRSKSSFGLYEPGENSKLKQAEGRRARGARRRGVGKNGTAARLRAVRLETTTINHENRALFNLFKIIRATSLCAGLYECQETENRPDVLLYVEKGDMVCVVPGCRFPVVIRSLTKSPDTKPFEESMLVSWCYVRGSMHGEALESEVSDISVLLS